MKSEILDTARAIAFGAGALLLMLTTWALPAIIFLMFVGLFTGQIPLF